MKWRCPTCNAPYRGGSTCYRCKSDLRLLLMILNQAVELRNKAIQFLKEGRLSEAKSAIRKSLYLYREKESLELEAIICSSEGDFSKALDFLKPIEPHYKSTILSL